MYCICLIFCFVVVNFQSFFSTPDKIVYEYMYPFLLIFIIFLPFFNSVYNLCVLTCKYYHCVTLGLQSCI